MKYFAFILAAFRTVLGIDRIASGFTQIKIEPHLGNLTNVSGEIPHPNGKVAVAYLLKKNKWQIKLDMPGKTFGIFIWQNKNYTLKPGANSFVL